MNIFSPLKKAYYRALYLPKAKRGDFRFLWLTDPEKSTAIFDALMHTNFINALNHADKSLGLLDAVSGNNLLAVKTFINYGADVDVARATDLSTPLHLAAKFGYDAILQALIDSSADAAQHTTFGETPLFLATMAQHNKCIHILRLRTNIADIDHCLDIASRKKNKEGEQMLCAAMILLSETPEQKKAQALKKTLLEIDSNIQGGTTRPLTTKKIRIKSGTQAGLR